MPVRIVCSACRTVMQVADELRGKKIKCKSCSDVVSVPNTNIIASGGEFAERTRMPSPPPPVKRRVVDDDDDDRSSPRRRRREKSSAGMLPWVIACGGVLGIGLIIFVVVLLVRSPSAPAQANNPFPNAAPHAGLQVAQNQAPAVQPAANVAPVKRNAPALIPDPPAGETMKGEQIYQRLLQSTVWIVADHRIGGGNNRPFAQIGDAQPFQFQPKIPKMKGPPIGPKLPGFPQPPGMMPGLPQPPGMMPGMPQPPGMNMLPQPGQKSDLRNTKWDCSETLIGFGKLTFRFITDSTAIMIDARDTTRGSYVHTGNNVTITFGGGIIYIGTINGNTMAGNATNGQDNWTWSVTKSGGGAPTPANPFPGLPGGGIVAKSSGSGSVIDRKHRLVITNVHVVGSNNDVIVYFPDFDDKGELVVRSDFYKAKPGYKGRVVMKEERADLALVQLGELPEGVQPLILAKNKAKPAQQVHSVGNPGASKGLWIYSPGKVRQVFQDEWKIRDELDGRTYNYNAMKLETNSPINPGDSGGPLVDDRCAMVGVAHGGSMGANNFSFFIEASEVRQLLQKYYASVGDNYTQ